MPERRDVWWTATGDTDRRRLGVTLRSVLEAHAVPFLLARISDEGLRDHWLRESPRGREGLGLAVLLRDLGPKVALIPLLDRIRAEAPPAAAGLVGALDRFRD